MRGQSLGAARVPSRSVPYRSGCAGSWIRSSSWLLPDPSPAAVQVNGQLVNGTRNHLEDPDPVVATQRPQVAPLGFHPGP